MNSIVLLIPLAASIALAIWQRRGGKEWRAAIAQGVALGFTLPLAIAYCLLLNWPAWTGGAVEEFATRFSIALVVMPQVYGLVPLGLMVWKRFFKSGATETGTGLPMALGILALALLGHLWTWAILSAGPVAA